MGFDCSCCHGDKLPVRAIRTFIRFFIAQTIFPLVFADGGISAFSGLETIKSSGIQIIPSPEKREKTLDFFRCWTMRCDRCTGSGLQRMTFPSCFRTYVFLTGCILAQHHPIRIIQWREQIEIVYSMPFNNAFWFIAILHNAKARREWWKSTPMFYALPVIIFPYAVLWPI